MEGVMKMASSVSSVEVVVSNDDILEEILLRVPPLQLLRFKSVSKRWLALISNPQFCHRHSRRNAYTRVSGVFLRSRPYEIEFLSLAERAPRSTCKTLDFVNDPTGLKILQSCNGLLLCSSLRKIDSTRKFYVYNPTTGRYLTLPPILAPKSATILGVNLAFDPSKSPHYTVVCVRSTSSSVYHYEIEIYSSEIGSWSVCGSPFVAPFDMVFDGGFFWNDALHWISPSGKSMCFDVERRCLKKMPWVPTWASHEKRRYKYFGDPHGPLHLMEIYGICVGQFNIFSMEGDYAVWVLKYRGDIREAIAGYPEFRSSIIVCDLVVSVLLLLRGGNDEDVSLLLHIPGKIIVYNAGNKTLKDLHDLSWTGSSGLRYGWLDAYEFIETLAWV